MLKKKGTLSYCKAWKNVRTLDQKSNCLTASGQNISNASSTNLQISNNMYVKLSPIDCERLQTVQEGYTKTVSDCQRYKMLGNGWTVDIIAWIFSHIKLKVEA